MGNNNNIEERRGRVEREGGMDGEVVRKGRQDEDEKEEMKT